MHKLALVISFLLMVTASSTAQKYGHINFGTLISAMPETKVADAALVDFQKQLVSKGEKMAKDFQTKLDNYLENANNITPKDAQKIESSLEESRQEILSYEQEVQLKINNKRQELLGPIIKKAEGIIALVAKERGYIMVFDTSIFNTILYAEEADDIMVFVAGKLGLD